MTPPQYTQNTDATLCPFPGRQGLEQMTCNGRSGASPGGQGAREVRRAYDDLRHPCEPPLLRRGSSSSSGQGEKEWRWRLRFPTVDSKNR